MPGPVRKHRDDVVLVRQIDHQPQRLAMAAPAGQPVDPDRVKAAVGAEDDQAVGGLGGDRKARPVAFLVFLLGGGDVVPLDGADPALFRAQHGYRLALDQRLGGISIGSGAAADLGAAPAERRVAAELGAGLPDLLGDRAPLPVARSPAVP